MNMLRGSQVVGVAIAMVFTASAVHAANKPAAQRSELPASAPTTVVVPPNAAITRRAAGTYRYADLKSGAVRGEERWQFFAHPDGSRTLLMWHDLAARNAQFSVILRADERLRPIEAFVNYWNGGAFKGSALFRVDGNRLTADARGPSGLRTDVVAVPESFSIGTHPVAGDGWHTWSTSPTAKGVQQSMLYAVEASADTTKAVLGTLTPLTIEYLGEETVDVPAGRFQALHVRIAGVNDLWITPRDRLVVKSVITARNLQYDLIHTEGSFE